MTRDLVNLFIGYFAGAATVILAFKVGVIVGKLFGA
jgi:hypothetical protein